MKQFDPSQCRSLNTIAIIGGTPEENKRIIQNINFARGLNNGITIQRCDAEKLGAFMREQQDRRFCIIEDATDTNEFIKLIQNTSYLRTSVFLPSNNILDMPPYIHVNIDCVYVSKNIDTKLKKKVYKTFARMFEHFDAFESTLTHCNDWLVLYFGNPSNKIEDSVFECDSKKQI